jgi:hypothetical protein
MRCTRDNRFLFPIPISHHSGTKYMVALFLSFHGTITRSRQKRSWVLRLRLSWFHYPHPHYCVSKRIFLFFFPSSSRAKLLSHRKTELVLGSLSESQGFLIQLRWGIIIKITFLCFLLQISNELSLLFLQLSWAESGWRMWSKSNIHPVSK